MKTEEASKIIEDKKGLVYKLTLNCAKKKINPIDTSILETLRADLIEHEDNSQAIDKSNVFQRNNLNSKEVTFKEPTSSIELETLEQLDF